MRPLVMSLMVALTGVLVACGTDPGRAVTASRKAEDRGSFAFPVRRDALGPPGTMLPNGFRVERGSWLLGTAFPEHIDARPVHEKEWYEWRALLALTGSPRDVAERYAAQARDLGYHAKASEITCREEANTERCFYVGRHHDSTEEDPVRFTVGVIKGPRSKSGWPEAYVRLKLGGAGAIKKPEPMTRNSKDADPASGPSPPENPPGHLPEVGEPFTDLQFHLDGKPLGPHVQLRIEDGAHLVAPPAYGGKNDSQLLAVLELPADARALTDAYAEQAARFYPADAHSESWGWGKAVVIERNRMCRGPCGAYTARAVIGPDDSGYLLIDLMLRPQ